MTVPATAEAFTDRLPTNSEREAADQLRKIIAASMTDDASAPTLRVHEPDGEPLTIALTPGMSGVLLDLLRYIAKGEAVTLVPLGEMLTTQQAADILNVSRPFLVKLLDNNEMAHTLVGRHRRIRAHDLFAYKRARDERRADALSDLAAVDGDAL